MKKQILLSFLAGLVLPLLLAAVFPRVPPVPEAESESISPPAAEHDAGVVLTVRNRSGNLQQLTLREYLVGVVLAEMPADFGPEALKAQAVVARTYTCNCTACEVLQPQELRDELKKEFAQVAGKYK